MGKPGGMLSPVTRKGAIPAEVKHLSKPRKKKENLDAVSSGERKRHSLNRYWCQALGRFQCGVVGAPFGGPSYADGVTKLSSS